MDKTYEDQGREIRKTGIGKCGEIWLIGFPEIQITYYKLSLLLLLVH